VSAIGISVRLIAATFCALLILQWLLTASAPSCAVG